MSRLRNLSFYFLSTILFLGLFFPLLNIKIHPTEAKITPEPPLLEGPPPQIGDWVIDNLTQIDTLQYIFWSAQ